MTREPIAIEGRAVSTILHVYVLIARRALVHGKVHHYIKVPSLDPLI